jgi:integrase
MLKLKAFSAGQLVPSGCSTGWLLKLECVRVNFAGCVSVTLTRLGNSFASVRLCGAARSKRRKRRTQSEIPIPVQIVDALRVQIGSREVGFVFATKNGTPWNADLLLKRHLRKKLKVVDGHLHMFRHTFATRQLHAGVPVAVVSKLLGHGSVSTTLNIYAHVLAEHLEQFERQRAKVLGISGTYRAPEVVGVAEEQQVA